ncbi:hypothetical protein LCGC14_2757820, partial [marine sediment metagenome]
MNKKRRLLIERMIEVIVLDWSNIPKHESCDM